MIEYLHNNYIDIIAATIGLVYLYLEFRASIWMWLISMLMAVFFIYTFYRAGLYASMCIYIYFFIASAYGWVLWWRSRKENNTSQDIVFRMPEGKIMGLAIFFAAAFAILYGLLLAAGTQTIYFRIGDAATTALNVVALWMASRKWAEQWWLLVPANFISGIMLHMQGNYATAVMFYIYAVVSIAGYYHWRKLARGIGNRTL